MADAPRQIYRQRRWKQSTLRISVYTLIVSIIWHAIVLFTFKLPKGYIGNWQRRPVLFWLTTPRESRSDMLPAINRLYPGTIALLDEPAMPSASLLPQRKLLSSVIAEAGNYFVTYNEEVKNSIAPTKPQRYSWDIRSDGDLFSEYSTTNSIPQYVLEQSAEFYVTAVFPSRHIIVDCINSSGDVAFDAQAMAVIKTLPLKAPVNIRTPDDAPYYSSESATVYVTLTPKNER